MDGWKNEASGRRNEESANIGNVSDNGFGNLMWIEGEQVLLGAWWMDGKKKMKEMENE